MRVNGKKSLERKKHLKCALFRSGGHKVLLSLSIRRLVFALSLPSLAVLNE